MAVSDKLAFEIYTIAIFHTVALLFLFAFSFSIYLRAKKTPLLYGYLAVVAMIMLWMVSKIMKTVSPNEGLRWFFIVTQYFGVEFLGFCLVVFAYIYTMGRIPSRKVIICLAVLPLISFVVILTNPLHMGFYSYFNFYKDRFGFLFIPLQTIQYIYLIVGIVMLSKGYTHQLGFNGKKAWANLFAVITLIPLLTNVYYILFKFGIFPWIFPFPVFDFTPVAATIALILFMIPALKFRFFDISLISYGRFFAQISQGIVFLDEKNVLYNGNTAFHSMFGKASATTSLQGFAEALLFERAGDIRSFLDYIHSNDNTKDFEMLLENSLAFKVSKKTLKNKHKLLCFNDISAVAAAERELNNQNSELLEINQRLDTMAQKTRELAIAKTKANIAQNMHDILGHSLTVVIGTADLAAADTDMDTASQKVSRIGELLSSGLNDLKNTFIGNGTDWGQTSLTKAVSHLKNQNIELDFVCQGNSYELNSPQTEAIFRLCQEAVTNAIKHGKARIIHIILRYKPDEVEVFAIDNGSGCQNIIKNHGLLGIEERFDALFGKVRFVSDGEHGFTINAVIPKDMPS